MVRKNKRYQVDRNLQEQMNEILEMLNCDTYGICYEEQKRNEWGGITTPHFITRPYYWGDDEAIAELPNFEFQLGDIYLDIEWYKYSLRGATSSIPIVSDTLEKIKAVAITEKILEKGVL